MFFIVVSKCICFIILLKMAKGEEKASSKSNMALAVYEPSKIFTIFQTEAREFTFAGHAVNISQDWDNNGVAAVVWDAALVLAKYLETTSTVDLAGRKVIELGAGTGLVGIVAGYLGAQVTITDRKMALDLARDNVKRNNLNTSLVDVQELDWGQDVSTFNPPFDYILGADIVYIEDTFPHLLKTIAELSDYKTIVLLSCKIRYKRDKNFLGLLNEKFEVIEEYYDKTVDIHIYKAVRRKDVK